MAGRIIAAHRFSLDGFGWVVTGGESGSGQEYQWDSAADWRKEFTSGGRRTMKREWAQSLRDYTKTRDVPFFFKQATATRPGQGEDLLGCIWHEYPRPPYGLRWAKEGDT